MKPTLYQRLRQKPALMMVQEIGRCKVCGGILTAGDEMDGLAVWVMTPDYHTTGVKELYCRGCLEDQANAS